MVMSRPNRLIGSCLLLALAGSPVQAQRYSPSLAQPGKAAKQRDGFIDFTLKRINSADQDYGQCISDGRKLLLEETVENVYFWSNVVSLGLLGCFFLAIMYQRRLTGRREQLSAQSLCQVHNALARAEAQIEEATRRNGSLMEALQTASQVVNRAPQARTEGAPPPAVTETKALPGVPAVVQVPASNAGASAGPALVESPPPKEATATPPSAPQLRLFSPDVDQIATINALQQQLIRCQERVKNLTRQVNEAQRRFQEEQKKNSALKGQ